MDQQQRAQERRERARELVGLLVSDRRPTPRQVLWAIRIAIILGVLVAIGYSYGITLWDWLKLLIVPAVIAGGGLWFNVQQREREQRIANERAQDEALQAYLDQMSQLLTDKERPLRGAQRGDDLSTVARARTLTVLLRLDGGRKRSVLEFLYESRLIDREGTFFDESDLIERRHNIVSLEHANLSGANLSGASLGAAYLGFGAYLIKANLSGASLRGASLEQANLRGANLRGATVTNEQLKTTSSLEGTTMPDGQKYEEWLKDKEGRGDFLERRSRAARGDPLTGGAE